MNSRSFRGMWCLQCGIDHLTYRNVTGKETTSIFRVDRVFMSASLVFYENLLFSSSWLMLSWMNELHVGTGPLGPDTPRPLKRALCAPYQNHRSLVALPKLQTAPKPILLISFGSRKKEPRCVCLSEARASHSQRMWAKVSSLTPLALHNGLSISLSRWRCLLRVLCPITLDRVLLKDRNLALKPGQVPEINSRACLWVCPRSRQLAHCWLIDHWLNFVLMTRLETPRTGSGPRNLKSRATPCQPIGDFIPLYSGMSRDPIKPHHIWCCVTGRIFRIFGGSVLRVHSRACICFWMKFQVLLRRRCVCIQHRIITIYLD